MLRWSRGAGIIDFIRLRAGLVLFEIISGSCRAGRERQVQVSFPGGPLRGDRRGQALTLFVCEASMSVEFFIRIAGMLVLAIGGIYLGVYLSRLASGPAQVSPSLFAMVGALVGLVITPFLTTRPLRLLRARVRQTS